MGKSLMPYAVRFLVGGITVAAVSVIAKLSPHVSGLLSAFPAVFITALILIRHSGGQTKSVDFARGGVHGVIGTFLTVTGTLAGLVAHWPWYIALLCGLAAYGGYGVYMVKRKPA